MNKFSANHIAIPTILKVEPNALEQIGIYLKDCDFNKVVIYFGCGKIYRIPAQTALYQRSGFFVQRRFFQRQRTPDLPRVG